MFFMEWEKKFDEVKEAISKQEKQVIQNIEKNSKQIFWKIIPNLKMF